MRYPLLIISAWLLFFATELLAPQSARTTTITFVNLDGVGEGFNDATPVAPVGDNTGTTLGAQRQIAAQFAADLWADFISSNVPILVDARFDAPNSAPPGATDPLNSLDCTANPPVIATAEPTTYHGNFAKAPKTNTWYPQALANSLAGKDLSKSSDIRAYFNSSVGTPQCLPDKGWYYGLDGNAQPDQFDFVTLVLRELAHGLGFITTVNLTNGQKLGGLDDVFSLNLKDVSAGTTGKLFSQMTDAERRNAIKNAGNLRWIGDKVVAAHGGDVPMYAPDPVNLDFSVSNWDTSLSPGELMVPFYSGANHDVGLAFEVLLDIGWPRDPGGTVKITALDDAVKEGTTTGFLVHRTGATDQPITVHYKISGNAKSGIDYETLLDHVDIPAGESSATITVMPFFDDVTKESDETVIVALQADPNPIPGSPPIPHYTLGFPTAATVTIQNNVVKFGAEAAPPGEVGVPYNFDIPVSGGEEPYKEVTISKGAPPAGLTLSGMTIQGTPAPQAKSASFTIKVTDQKNVSAIKSYRITIVQPVAITTKSLKPATKNIPYTVFLKASGGKKKYTWLVSSGALPASLQLVPGAGAITGTPTAADVNTYNLTFKVTDALGGTAEQALTLTIN